jgi:hypothetical protein
MGGLAEGSSSLADVAHIIQTALTPVFLLSGIGALLNVFNQRLARVSDHVAHLTELLAANGDGVDAATLVRHLRRLSHRRVALDVSVVLGALAGASTCGAAFALFLVTLRDSSGGTLLLWLFGGALTCTIAALMAFVVDTILGLHGIWRDGPMPRSKPAGG